MSPLIVVYSSLPSVEVTDLNQLTHQEYPASKQVATRSITAGLADISEEQLKPIEVKLSD
eukprot:6566837-Ditylum_brightwellii.AAC.1